jgi:tripartite-type tricarboxylate transporter receptor subunit TctC
MQRSWNRSTAAFATALFTSLAASSAPVAQSASSSRDEADFFRQKTIRLVVGYGTGGGFDAYARMIAPYVGRKLEATVLVENMPGAGGLIALNRTAASPPDGLTMQLANGTGAILSQLIESKAARYDVLALGHLGTVSSSPWMWMVGPNSPIRTLSDATRPGVKLTWAGGGPTDGLSDGAAFTCEALKLSCRIVLGYKGSNDAALAVMRGEMDAIYVSETSAHTYATTGGARPVMVMGRARSRHFPQTPSVFDVAELDAPARWLLEFRTALDELGRILVVPPHMPPRRLAALQAAVAAALADPALIAEGARTQRHIGFIDAVRTRRNVEKVLAEPSSAQRAEIRALIDKAQ